MNRSQHQYDSWADFKASSDFDPVAWLGLEGVGGDAGTVIADLEQTDGRGISYLLNNTSGWSGESGFISALSSYDSTNTIALNADAWSPNGTVASVEFSAYIPGTGWTTLGTVTSAEVVGSDGFILDVAPSSLAGATKIKAVATDSLDQTSDLTQIISPVILGQITANSAYYINGVNASITVASSLTLASGGSISGVKFYLDTSGTGIYNPAKVQQLTGTLTSNGSGGYTLSGIDTTGWVGNATIFVIAYDSSGNTNCPAAGTFVLAAAAQPQPAIPKPPGKFPGWSKQGVAEWTNLFGNKAAAVAPGGKALPKKNVLNPNAPFVPLPGKGLPRGPLAPGKVLTNKQALLAHLLGAFNAAAFGIGGPVNPALATALAWDYWWVWQNWK